MYKVGENKPLEQASHPTKKKGTPKGKPSSMSFDEGADLMDDFNEGKVPEDKKDYDLKKILRDTYRVLVERPLKILALQAQIDDLEKTKSASQAPDKKLYSLQMELSEQIEALSDQSVNFKLNVVKNRLKEERDDLKKANETYPSEENFLRIDELSGEIQRIRNFQMRHGLPLKAQILNHAYNAGSKILSNAKIAGEYAAAGINTVAQHAAAGLGVVAQSTADKVSELGEMVSIYVPSLKDEDWR